MRIRLLALLSAAVVVAGCGSGDSSKEKEAASTPASTPVATPTAVATTPAPTETAAAPANNGCPAAKQPKSKGEGKLSKPTTALDPTKTYTAVVTTSCGEFQIKLDVKRAPKTAASFAYLADKKFYDQTTFHRIVPGFVIQGGDPLGTGTGGPGYTVVEAPPQSLKYTNGVVAMAKGGNEPSGASGSQFFVVTGGNVQLPPDYALLGTVTSGGDTVGDIGTAATDPNTERPLAPIVIESIRIKVS
jgi:cyclophilin family peptidyl-prolyl cis-trans isomerase